MFWSLVLMCYGQLGLGDNQNRNKPELLMTDPEIKQIICGGYHTMIWRNNGDVLVFGYNVLWTIRLRRQSKQK